MAAAFFKPLQLIFVATTLFLPTAKVHAQKCPTLRLGEGGSN